MSLQKFLKFNDDLCEWAAFVVMWFPFILTLIICYEIVSRYIFGYPSPWVHDMSWMLFSAHFMIGLGITARLKKHIRVDVFSEKFAPKTEAHFGVFFHLLFLFVCIVLVKDGIPYALQSISQGELSSFSMSNLPIYPLKALIPISFFLLGLQEINGFIRAINFYLKRGEL